MKAKVKSKYCYVNGKRYAIYSARRLVFENGIKYDFENITKADANFEYILAIVPYAVGEYVIGIDKHDKQIKGYWQI